MSGNYHFLDGNSGMVIVSKCPRCGAPIYAPNIWHGNEAPPISHTCECRNYRPLSDYLPQSAPFPEGIGQPPPGIDLAPGMMNLDTSATKPYSSDVVPFSSYPVGDPR